MLISFSDAVPDSVHIGGAEKAIIGHTSKLRLQMEAKKLAEEKTEFVVNSKEELEGIMKCTACKRAILSLHNQILGRVSTSSGRSIKKTKKVVLKIIKKVCKQETITSTPEIVVGCNEFVKENKKLLLEAYLPRCIEEDDLFEERFPVTQFCRFETTACPKGIQSLDELLGKKIDEQRAADAADKSHRNKHGKKKKKNVKQNQNIEDIATKLHQTFKGDTKQINENNMVDYAETTGRKKKKRKRRKRKRKKRGGNNNDDDL